MLKVIIADDEVHICSLLKYLIDWKGLGMELAASFCDGQAVLDYLEKHPADVLLCDIEMPGLNGIELMQRLSVQNPELKIIVISGFRSFDYVRSAMQFGACNYLLKPINENELNRVLTAVAAQLREGTHIQENILLQASARKRLLESILKEECCGQNLEEENRKFGYRFATGIFQFLYVTFPGEEADTEQLRLNAKSLEDTLRPMLADFCQDFEFFRQDERHLCVLMNVSSQSHVNLPIALDAALNKLVVELSCKRQETYFIGVGIPVDTIEKLLLSYTTATRISYKRFFIAPRKIAYAETNSINHKSKMVLTISERQMITHNIENIDPEMLGKTIRQVFSQHMRVFETYPNLLLKVSEEIVQQLLHTMTSLNNPLPNPMQFFQTTLQQLELTESLEQWQEVLCKRLNAVMSERLDNKTDNVKAYAQQAKQYIDKHYGENVTLEKIADKIGINPAYLSAVFKNDLQMNYSKYLLMVRMEKAKELLRQCDKNLTEISKAVGYDRTAYFSSAFRVYTGLHPKEYQRLYQSGLGDTQ